MLLKHLAMQTQDWAVSLLHSTVMVLLSVLVVQTNTAEVYYLSSLTFTLARKGYSNGIASAACCSLPVAYSFSGHFLCKKWDCETCRKWDQSPFFWWIVQIYFWLVILHCRDFKFSSMMRLLEALCWCLLSLYMWQWAYYRVKNYYWPLAVFRPKLPNGQPLSKVVGHLGQP